MATSPSSATAISEDWMYFKQNPDDKWLLKYCRCQSPFLFIYKNEDLKRKGKPDMILIINDNLFVNKTNDRIAYCGYTKIKQTFSYAKDHWSVVTRDGYVIIGKIYHVDADGIRMDDTYTTSTKQSKFSRKSGKKSKRKTTKSRAISIGFDDDDINDSNNNAITNRNKSSSKWTVIATKEHDEIDRVYKWDVANIKVIHSGSPEVVVEERGSKTKLAQLRFNTKEEAALFTESIKECMKYLNDNRERLSTLHPDITGIGKPLFPLMIEDKKYDKTYYFISLNRDGIDKWNKILQPTPIDPLIKPLINRLEMEDSSLVNLDEVDEIFDLISRDLNIMGSKNNSDAMQKIINLPMEKRILILHMNAISSSFQGVHYWISILMNPKDPKHVLRLFQKHLDKQAVKKAKFIEQFVENDGLLSLLTIQKKLIQDITMSDGEECYMALRSLLAKVFETIASAPPYNETIREDEATDQQKYQARKRKQAASKQSGKALHSMANPMGSIKDSSKKSGDKTGVENVYLTDNNNNNMDADDDDLIDEDEMRRLYGDTDSDSSDEDDDVKQLEEKDDAPGHSYKDLANIPLTEQKAMHIDPMNINNIEIKQPKLKLTGSGSSYIFGGKKQTITHNGGVGIAKAIQIRYKSGAEVLFDSEQKEEVIEYLVTSIWGFHETEVLKDDLAPGIGVIKCLFTLCLLKSEFAAFITTILLDVTDIGKENDNWWLPLTQTMENVLEMYCTSSTIFSGTGNMFIIQDQCRNFIFGLLTLILTMIDGFDIDDRIIERRMLDTTKFDKLLLKLQENIQEQQLHAIIELYKQSKIADINEVAYSQMEITQEFLDYLRDKTIENGFHEYFSNILTNMATFPDDAEEAWINVDQYVYHWRNKFDAVDQESNITDYDENDENHRKKQNVDTDEVKRGGGDGDGNGNGDGTGNGNENGLVSLSDVQISDLGDKDKSFLSMEQIDQLDKTNALSVKTEKLSTEITELNSKYQTQLTQNNELQGLLKEYRDKLSVLENQIKEMAEKKDTGGIGGDGKGTGDGKGSGDGTGNGVGDGKGGGDGKGNMTEEQRKKLEAMNATIKDKKKDIVKYKPPEDKKEDDKKDKKEEEKKKEAKPGELPPLSAEDEKLVEKYKKQLKMRVPAPAVKHKMKFKEKVPHLIPYVFPEEAAKFLAKQQEKDELPPLSTEDAELVEKYKKQLKMRVPGPAIKHKIKFKEKKPHLIPYVFPEEADKMKASKKNSDLPNDMKEKPKIKPSVEMLPFHWNKTKQKTIKSTIWYDIYHKYSKYKENEIFDLKKLDELFGKPKETKKKTTSKQKKNTNTNSVPAEVIVLDKKTRQKVDIFLSQVRMNWNMSTMKICDHITNMNERGLSHDHIEKLRNVAPNAKETDEFQNSIKGLSESDMLGKAALFWQELLNVDPYIEDRLDLWDFKLSFKGLITEEQDKTDMLNACIIKIRNDDKFKRVLALSLDIGNYVNGGKRQGQAYGFNIATLEKLDQFPRRRNPDGSPVPTMLEYIYKLLEEKDQDVLSWPDNLSILNEAVTIDLNVINTNLKKFETKIGLLYDRLKSSDETQFSGKNFVHKMKPFYDDSCKQLSRFTDSVNSLNNELKGLGEWFDIDDGDNLEFLKQINAFRKTFKSIGPRLIKRQKDAERKAKRAKKLKSMGRRGRQRKIPKTIDSTQHTLVAKGTTNKPPAIQGGVQIPGFNRRGSILRAVAGKQPLKLDPAGNLAPQWSKGSAAGRSRGPSVSVRSGGLRNELWKFAASVDNKVKV